MVYLTIIILIYFSARVTFVDSASAKRAIDTVNGALFSGNKIYISFAPPDNFLFLGNLALSIDEGILEVG